MTVLRVTARASFKATRCAAALALAFAMNVLAMNALAIVVLAMGVLTTGVLPAAAERTLERLADFDLPGGDYQTLRQVPIAECEDACLADRRCAGFTYNERARWCFLKSSAGDRQPYSGATSAIVRDTAAPGNADAPLPLPDLAFLPADVATEAQRLEALVAAVRRTSAPAGLVNVNNADDLAARTTDAWLSFARSVIAVSYDDYATGRDADSIAGAAGYLALRDARRPAEQGRALAMISVAMERQGLFRPAIEASAASLLFDLDQAERERLDRLRTEHGFRVLDYSVDADNLAPRLCVQTSETIRGDASALERFVAADRIPSPTVTVSGSQICVEGLAHGERYNVTLRAGLPSVTGENLRQPAEFRAYVRDRSPIARFDTNRYVLPASAAGVPVTTVNTAELVMKLYRINDRNLAEVVRSGDFKRQLYGYEADQIAEERGSLAFEGKMTVELRRNIEVTTLFPLDGIAVGRVPGVYVLTALPAERAEQSDSLATQWFVVSDLGLSTYSATDGGVAGGIVDVFVRSLEGATPTEGVSVALLAKNNAVLGTGRTDRDGHVRLVSSGGRTGGEAPALVTATTADDYAFLSLVGGAFELTDRGVAGRTAPGPVDAFLATERGVYRGGETVHLTALVRDDAARALAVPVTVRLVRPDGVVSRVIATRTEADGGVALDLPLTGNAQTGTWELSAYVDPDGDAVGTTTFLVEDYVPQRIRVDLASSASEAVAGEPLSATVDAAFLYGAPAAGLMLEGSVTVRPAENGIPGYEGYRFGLEQEPFSPERAPLFDLPRTDDDGRATLAVPVPDVAGHGGALEARIVVAVREPGGRQVSDALTLPLDTRTPMIGIKHGFADGQVAEGSRATFEVIALSPDRTRAARDAEWSLTRIEQDFQWYRREGRWFYDSINREEEIAKGSVALGTERPATISSPVAWGRYRLEIADINDPAVASSTTFDAGWVSGDVTAETPDVLEIHLDKESYAAGETATLRIVPRFAGKALVTVLGGSLLQHRLVDVPAASAQVAFTVLDGWAPGAYVAATLFRPVGHAAQAGTAAEARPLPQRSVGIAQLGVNSDDRRLTVAIEAPEIALPRQPLTVPVAITGLTTGEVAHLTLAAVDVGILNITGFTPPDADEHFLGQRRLSVELRDLYGDLIDSAGAARGSVRSGGDGPGSGTEALPLNEKPVALFSGVVTTGADGVARVTLDIPSFNGTLNLMAIAWTTTRVGDASREMVVRDPVVVSATLPRFLAPGDATRMHVDLHNVAHQAGAYQLAIRTEGPVAFDHDDETFRLAVGERASVELPLAATGVGTATVVATLTGPGGLSIAKDYTLTVRPAAAEVAQRRLIALAPGDSFAFDANLVAGFTDDATVTMSVGGGDIDTAGLLQLLDRFPYGCAEQTVSRALPLLYLNEVAEGIGLDADTALPQRIDDAIDRVLAFQDTTGGFGLWSPGTDLWLTAYVMDFLSRAREAGYDVPQPAFESGLDRLRSVLSYVGEVEGERGSEIAYATYVLARNGRAAIGDLRYFAEEKLDKFQSPLARAQLAASLSFSGDDGLASRLFRDALNIRGATLRPDRVDYGTTLRDAAAIVTLAAESRVERGTVAGLADRLSAVKAATGRNFSTQEAAWLLLAANANRPPSRAVSIDGEPANAPLARRFDRQALQAGVAVRNDGAASIALATTVTGTPLTPQRPVSEGLTIARRFHTLDGAEIDSRQVAQNTRLLVRLTVVKTVDDPMRLMLTDLLPAGFEIENPRLVGEGDIAGLPLAAEGQTPGHTEFRDDRFAAAWQLGSGGANIANSVTYMIRAVSPGTFVLPAAEVSDMYQPGFVARTATGTVAVTPTR